MRDTTQFKYCTVLDFKKSSPIKKIAWQVSPLFFNFWVIIVSSGWNQNFDCGQNIALVEKRFYNNLDSFVFQCFY